MMKFFYVKEIGLEVNAEEPKYLVSWDKNKRQNHNIKTDNSSFERVEQFKYLGTILMNQNSIQEEQSYVTECFCLPVCFP